MTKVVCEVFELNRARRMTERRAEQMRCDGPSIKIKKLKLKKLRKIMQGHVNYRMRMFADCSAL